MCKLDGTKCDNCVEYQAEIVWGAHSEHGNSRFEFTLDPRDGDNQNIMEWLFTVANARIVSVRSVGDVVWSDITKEEWEIG